jgi:PmbA protein
VTDAREIAARALHPVTTGDADAIVLSERSGLARFASSEIHQPTLIENTVVILRIVRDGRIGTAMTNRVDDEGLRDLATRAGEAADSAVAEADFPGLPTPEPVPAVEGYDEALAQLGADDLARHARKAIDVPRDVDVFGFVTSGLTQVAIASTKGVDVSQRMTDATTLVIAAGDGASGYGEQTTWSSEGFTPDSVGVEATQKAVQTRGAKSVEPAVYRAVLEPYALADLLQAFSFDAFGAIGLLEERSYLAGRLGEKIMDEKVSIADDPLDSRGLPKAFDFEGVPKQRVDLIENGVARGVVWDRTTAARAGSGRESTGHAPPPVYRQYGPLAFSLSMDGGEAESTEELVDVVGDGIYVTRVHYLGIVDPREGVITGMTRDGTFRIRDGKIAEPLVNLRFTVAVPRVLADVPALMRDPKLCNINEFYGERYPAGALVPGIATAYFNVTGVGSEPGV